LVPIAASKVIKQVPICAPKISGKTNLNSFITPALHKTKIIPIIAPLLCIIPVTIVDRNKPASNPLIFVASVEANKEITYFEFLIGITASFIIFNPRKSKPKPISKKPIFLTFLF